MKVEAASLRNRINKRLLTGKRQALYFAVIITAVILMELAAPMILMTGCSARDAADSGNVAGPGQSQGEASEDKPSEGEANDAADKASQEASEKALADSVISRREVFRIKSGTHLSKKKIKSAGGYRRFFRIYKIRKGGRVYKRINGRSYRENPNIALSDLRYVKTLYYDFDGKVRAGELIVNKSIAVDIKEIFIELYKIKYEIRKMKLIDSYYSKGGSGTDADTKSMNDDNTSAFNYRTIAGTRTISMHGYGRAIDINPFENPWCPGGKLYPNQSRSAAYANRGASSGERKPHMIFRDSEITGIFRKHGFRWLGETDTRDYQHFEK